MTTVYEAINLAADHIERNPNTYFHGASRISGGSADSERGCSIVWIARLSHRGFKPYTQVEDAANQLGLPMTDCNNGEYFDRLTAIAGSIEWRFDAKICAATLRKYAEKYHAPRDLIPAGVREIFSRTYTAKDLTV